MLTLKQIKRQFAFRAMIANQPFYQFMEGEGEGGEGEGGEGEGGEGGGGQKTFTQEDVDRIINKRFAKERKEKETLATQLKTLQQSKSLSTEEQDRLQKQIDELETSLLTKDEQAAQSQKKLEEKYARELKREREGAEFWERQFRSSRIERSLLDAAIENDAENREQIVQMFRGATYLARDKDDAGKDLDSFTVRLKFRGLDPDAEGDEKKIVDLDMPVEAAVAKLKTDGLNKNLFKHSATGGTGVKGQGQGGAKDPDAMPTLEQFGGDHRKYSAAYQDWRSTHNLDGSRKKTT